MKNKKIMRLEFRGETTLAVTQAGQKIQLGGFSGLRFLGKNSDGKLRFLTLTDRGPNASEEERNGHIYRPFALPEFQPRIVFLLADTQAGTFSVEKVIPLLRPDGKPLSGLPPHEGGEIPVSLKNEPLPYDPYGMDPEGIVQQADGTFWIGEEYGPSLAHFSAEGQLLEVLKPGQGLPKVFEQIKLNRGFEGLAMGNGKLYGMLQSPLDNPRSEGQKNSAASHLVRIVAVDPEGQKTLGQYAYLLGPGKADKIGDIAVAGPDEFYAIEQNGKEGAQSIKKVFRFRLGKATNLQLLPEKIVGPGGTLESIKRGKLAEAGVIPAEKEELCDLAELGVKEAKVEGIDLLGEKSIAVIVDNDFGLAGEWDRKNGTAVMKDEKPALYLINLD
ncbi:MAG: esterase-like activity of phytase family protein [Bdellovibrionota bacterium]